MRHIGDGDQQTPALAQALAIDRVIKIPRVLAVYGDKGQVLQRAPVVVRGILGLAQAADLRLQRRRPEMRQFMALHGDLHGHIGIEAGADHADHAANRLAPFVRLSHDPGHDKLSGAGPVSILGGDQQILAQAFIIRRHKAYAALFKITPDQLPVRPFQHLDQRPLAPALPIHMHLPHQHPIAVQNGAHLARGQKQILAARLRHDKAVALRMADHPALEQVHLVNQAITAAPIADQLGVARHRPEPPPQDLARLGVFDGKGLGQLPASQRSSRLPETGHNGRPLRDFEAGFGLLGRLGGRWIRRVFFIHYVDKIKRGG